MEDVGIREGIKKDRRTLGKSSLKDNRERQAQKEHEKGENNGDEDTPGPERLGVGTDEPVCPGVAAGRVSEINEAGHVVKWVREFYTDFRNRFPHA